MAGEVAHAGPTPIRLSWLNSIKSLKLVKLLQVRNTVILVSASGMRVWHQEYTKYDPPGAKVSDDALAQKYLLYTPPSWLKRRI
jgi:hypothetical protein